MEHSSIVGEDGSGPLGFDLGDQQCKNDRHIWVISPESGDGEQTGPSIQDHLRRVVSPVLMELELYVNLTTPKLVDNQFLNIRVSKAPD